MLRTPIVPALLLLSAACAPQAPPVDLEAERGALLAVDREWAALAEAGQDVDAIVSYWSDDALVISAGDPPVRGREALREMVASTLDVPGMHVTWETDEVHLSPDARMAWMTGTNAFTAPDSTGAPVTVRGRTATVWEKNEAGEWKCVFDMWTPIAE